MKSRREFFHKVHEALAETERDGLLIDRREEGLSGLSGLKTLGALERLVRLFKDTPDTCYLEVGVFQGLSLVSVALGAPGYPCFGIDDFSILDPDGRNLEITRNRMAEFDVTNATLINQDFEGALANLDAHLAGRRVAVYFIDGAHDYRSQLMGLLLALPCLHEDAVILIDDANYAFVRQSTRDFLVTHPDWRMVFEAYSPAHPANLDAEALARYEAGWLNGINILVRDPEGLLGDMTPAEDPRKPLYVNDWLVHRHLMAPLAPQALDLAQALHTGEGEAEARLRFTDAARDAQLDAPFADRNTFSAGLTEGRFNPGLPDIKANRRR